MSGVRILVFQNSLVHVWSFETRHTPPYMGTLGHPLPLQQYSQLRRSGGFCGVHEQALHMRTARTTQPKPNARTATQSKATSVLLLAICHLTWGPYASAEK